MRKWIHAVVWPVFVLIGLLLIAQILRQESHHVKDIGVLLDERGTHSIDDVKSRRFENLGKRPVFPVAPAVGLFITGTLYKFLAEGRKLAALFATAWDVGLISYFIWSFYRNGLIEGVWFFGYFTTLGRMIEMMVLMVVIFLRLRDLQLRLGYAKAKLEGAEIVKTLFRSITHDLSNTSQVIILSGSSLSQEKSPAQFDKIKNRIIRAAEAQRDMINHAKKAYLMRGGNIVELDAVDLNQTIRKVVESVEARLSEKRIRLNLVFASERLYVLAENISLENQVLANLLINAIKFSNPDRKITIATRDIDDLHVECTIEDQGIGIPSEIFERLFDERKPVSRAGTFGEVGTGNGMLIVKDFLSAYGAELAIASTVDVGTKITMHFRRAEMPKMTEVRQRSLDH